MKKICKKTQLELICRFLCKLLYKTHPFPIARWWVCLSVSVLCCFLMFHFWRHKCNAKQGTVELAWRRMTMLRWLIFLMSFTAVYLSNTDNVWAQWATGWDGWKTVYAPATETSKCVIAWFQKWGQKFACPPGCPISNHWQWTLEYLWLLQSHLTWEWMQIVPFPIEDNYKTLAGFLGFLSTLKGELFKGAICENCLLAAVS